MRGDRNPTLGDVARAAGVSPATVSRFLNRADSVRADKRLRIHDAVERLRYVPHAAARALASRKTRMVGAVFPSLDGDLFGGALEAFQKELAREGYSVVVASSEYDADQDAAHIRNLLTCGVDALLVVGAVRSPQTLNLLVEKDVPFVQLWVADALNGHPCIGFDNQAAAEHVTDHLLMLGHRRFGVISGILEGNDRAQGRLNGVRASLARQGLSLADDQVHEMPFGAASGRDAFSLLMASPERPTAVICGSEPFAYGALLEAQSMGLRVPDDVSVTGFDDMWLASQLSPSLTTVWTPRREMGRDAARYLLAKLTGKAVAKPRPLETRLVVRQSTAPPPRQTPSSCA